MARHARNAGTLGNAKAEAPAALRNAAEKAATPVEKALYAKGGNARQGRHRGANTAGPSLPFRFFDISRQPPGLTGAGVKRYTEDSFLLSLFQRLNEWTRRASGRAHNDRRAPGPPGILSFSFFKRRFEK